MPSLLNNLKSKSKSKPLPFSKAPPPAWAPAPEISHRFGLSAYEASNDSYESAEDFCATHPPEMPRLLSSNAVERIGLLGCKAWGIQHPNNMFVGSILNPGDAKGGDAVVRVQTSRKCQDTCLLSDLPILAGLYDIQGKTGVYYEVNIIDMDISGGGAIAVGTACRPYPNWRLPGWNRLSGALHLDDMRKYFEDPDGGRDYLSVSERIAVRSGDIIGCGYEFQSGSLFFTCNGMRLPPAFVGVYLPRTAHDVYAAVGITGTVELKVNFGGESFRWKEGNEWSWRVEGHVGKLGGGGGGDVDELPTYWEASSSMPRRM